MVGYQRVENRCKTARVEAFEQAAFSYSGEIRYRISPPANVAFLPSGMNFDFSTVYHELDVIGQGPGDFGDDVSLEQADKRTAVRRAEHQKLNAKSRREVQDGGGRAFADRVQRDDRDPVL